MRHWWLTTMIATYRVHLIQPTVFTKSNEGFESCDIVLIRRSGVTWRVFFPLDFNKQYTGFAYENLLALSKVWVLRNRSYSGTRNRKNDSTFPQGKNKQWRTMSGSTREQHQKAFSWPWWLQKERNTSTDIRKKWKRKISEVKQRIGEASAQIKYTKSHRLLIKPQIHNSTK